MAFVVDIVIVAILLTSVFLGYKRGLVKTVFNCLSLVVAIILASMFGAYAGNLIKSTKIFNDVSENIASEISDYFDKTAIEGIENAMSADINLEASPVGRSHAHAAACRYGADGHVAVAVFFDLLHGFRSQPLGKIFDDFGHILSLKCMFLPLYHSFSWASIG